MAIIPNNRHEQVNSIIGRLVTLDLLKHFKSMNHLTNGTYEVFLSQISLSSKMRSNINSFNEIKDISLERGSVRIEFDFTEGQQTKTSHDS